MARRLSTALALTLAVCASAGDADAMELLSDPGFEDPRPLLPEHPDDSDPWRLTFFTPAPVATDAMTMPNNGLEHASLKKDHSLPNADPQIDTAAFAGFGGAAGISDFTGIDLTLSVEYKVIENSVLDAGGTEPGTFVRMFVSYFGAAGFLGFGTFNDAFESGVTPDYVNYSFVDTVPDFGSPVTVVAYNLAVLGQFGGTGTATVLFDDASLSFIPEPTTVTLMAITFVPLALVRRR